MQLQPCTSVIAVPAIKSACCVRHLKYYYYTIPTVSTFKCKCGMLQHARCFDSRPALYISLKDLHEVCCAILQTLPLQLNSSGLCNSASHSSICTSPVFMLGSSVFLGSPISSGSGSGKSELLVTKRAYLRCLAGTVITVHCKHTHKCQTRWPLWICSSRALELLTKLLQPGKTAQPGNDALHWGPSFGLVSGTQKK